MQRYRQAFILAILAIGVTTARPYPALAAGSDEAAGAHVIAAQEALHASDYLTAVREFLRAAELSDSAGLAREAAQMAFSFGFDDEARLATERWLELEPDSDEALFTAAQLALRAGELKDAARHFEILIEQSERPADEQLLTLLGLFAEEDPADVNKLIRLLAKPHRDSAMAQYAMAASALQAGEIEDAMELALVAAEMDPEWLKPKLLYGRAMLLDGQVDEAIDYTARIIGDDPSPDPDARLELARMLMSVNRDEDALGQVNQVMLEQSGRGDALRLMAIINFRLDRLDAAWDDFEELLASGRYATDALYYLARIADVRGEQDRAVRLYQQIDKGSYAVASQRRAAGLMAFPGDDPEGALEHLDQFSDDHPTYAVDMILARAHLLTSLERFDEALDAYAAYVRFRPGDENAALGRAEILLRTGQVDAAIEAYRAAARRWPDSATTLNALGYTLADRTDQYREAEKLIRKALRYEPDSPAIIDSYGWVLYKRGDVDEALEQLRIAYDGFPNHEVAAHLVEVLVMLERSDEALELLLTAEEQDPDSEILQEVRERFFPQAP